MSRELELALGIDAKRYEALFHISEAVSACTEPEDLARVLADQLRDLVSFDHLDALIFKENSNEIEWQGWGTEALAFPDLPVEETSSWHVFRTQELERRQYIPAIKTVFGEWRSQDRFCHSRAIDHRAPSLRNTGHRQP